jgi:hypothetical protein
MNRGERADGRSDEDFYERNLAPLGFNLSLVPDHVAKFVLFCFTRKPRGGMAALPTDERLCEQVRACDAHVCKWAYAWVWAWAWV